MKKSVLAITGMVYFIFAAHNAMGMEFQLSGDSSRPASLSIIPQPFKVTRTLDNFKFNQATVLLVMGNESAEEVKILRESLKSLTSFALPAKKLAGSNYIGLIIDSVRVPMNEGYTLVVNRNHIMIKGHDGAGLFYGLQTLLQLTGDGMNATIPGCAIEDHPRFAYRGMHLDVSRHFFSAETVKKWINALAFYKINTFHWHLTDDQGWRIEIKAFPELQTVAAYRSETLIGHKKDDPHVFDGKRYGGYYTQDEVKQIVEYAAARHINIIPEIEMPGHAQAALAAYPYLGCTGGPYQTATFWGIFNDVFCAGNDSTFYFLQRVLNEVLTLFPSKYIHIGGDECPKERWHKCPRCRKRMAEENLKDENELQSYFVKRIEKYLNSKGRQIIGWDEILEGGLSPGATVMSWRGEEGGIEAARLNHAVVMTPEKFVYLDYYQSLYAGEPLAGGGYLPLKKMYDYEPMPSALNEAQSKYILGVQANVWTEYMDSEAKAEYMIFPRILALAEMAWSSKTNRNYPDFLIRLRQQSGRLKKMDIQHAVNFDEISYAIGQGADGKTLVGLHTDLPGHTIHYTLDGSRPGIQSEFYTDVLVIDKEETITAGEYQNGKQSGRLFQKHFLFHKAVGKPVAIRFLPAENYNPGTASALVNGVEGSNLYNDGQWFGFSGQNLEAVIDLGSLQNIHKIGINILKYHWQKMWEPVELSFWISADGINYQQVFSERNFPLNGINSVSADFKEQQTRYVKVIAVNRGTIPAGEYIAGAKALLMVDEIMVY